MKTYVLLYLAQFFLEWGMFQTKVVQKLKTHILCSVTLFENLAVYEIMWKNIVVRGRPHMTIWRMRIACCIPKATHTHTLSLFLSLSISQYVIFIAFPLQQWSHERISMLRYTYTVCLVLRPAVFTVKRSVFRGFLKRSLAGKWLGLLTLQTREVWRMFVRAWMWVGK
jgi:hypothetical protein